MQNTEMRWPVFRRVARREKLTELMLDRLGIEPLSLARLDQGEAFQVVSRTCFECTKAHECRHWLAHADITETPPRFCPNLDTLQRCRKTDEPETPN